MKQLVFISVFVIVCLLTVSAMPYQLYTFEDNAMRRITIRFIGNSTVIVSSKDSIKGLRHASQLDFIDEYTYNWINEHEIQIQLRNTDRKDMGVKRKTIPPVRMNDARKVEYSTQIFPYFSTGIIYFSEDFSLLRIESFLFEKKNIDKWLTDTNLVSPLLYARLGLMMFSGHSYTYCDRKERNLTFEFLDEETIQIQNLDKNGGKYNFVDIYKVKPKKNLLGYTIVKLISTTRQERKKDKFLPPLCNNEIICCNNILPNLEKETIYFNLNYNLLQIDKLTFKYCGEMIPLGMFNNGKKVVVK